MPRSSKAATRTATRSLLRNGAGRLQAFFYGCCLPNAAELTSYTVYRWECAIRSSVVLGFVGAGGLGQQMDSSMKMFNGGEVSTMLLVFVVAGGRWPTAERLAAQGVGLSMDQNPARNRGERGVPPAAAAVRRALHGLLARRVAGLCWWR